MMSDEQAPGKLVFRRVSGEETERDVTYGDDLPAGEYLLGRVVRFEDGREFRQHRPAAGAQRNDGYERLDSEILAGRRLYELADWAYPPEVTRLYGDEATSADPYTLFEPYEGRPLREVAAYLGDDEFEAFLTSFLTGMSWIAAAGIAHRAISPDTVLWDTRRGVLITDFSRSTIFGAPRAPLVGYTGWVPQELRPSNCFGTVGPRDDVWAAGRLIFFARNQGEELADRSQLADLDELFNGMFNPVFGPPDSRPTARELLADGLKPRVVPPSAADRSARLRAGREDFLELRERKHPEAARPADLNADIDWMGDQGAGYATPVNGHHPAPAGISPASGESPYPARTAEKNQAETEARRSRVTSEATKSRPFSRKRGDS